jgi:hypothetical protein
MEQGPKIEQSVEKIFTSLLKVIQSVIDGDEGSETFLVFHRQKCIARLPESHSISILMGRKILERVQRELEYDFVHDSLGERKEIDFDHYQESPQHLPTKYPNIELMRAEVFNRFEEKEGPEAVIWSIRNLNPKTRRDKALDKIRELEARVRRKLGQQYFP